MATKKATERQVLVLITYRIKKDYVVKGLHKGDVILVVRNDENVDYSVTLRRNGSHTCTCEGKAVWNKDCYHLRSSKAQFNARIEARKAAKVDAMPAQTVVKATPVAIEPAYVMSDAVREKLAAIVKPAEVVVETVEVVIERKQAWDKDLCARVFIDTREIVDPGAYAEMLKPQREAAEERMMNAALTTNKAFSIL